MYPSVVNNVPRTSIKPSKIHGYGLFSDIFIEKDSVAGYLDGQVLDVKDCKNIMFEEEWNSLSSEYLLVRPIPTKYRFINHSYDPNLRFDLFRRVLMVKREVAINDELTLNYLEHGIPQIYLDTEYADYLRQ